MSRTAGAVRRGEVRLWITYWLWGVGGNMLLLAALIIAYLSWAPLMILWALWIVAVLWHAIVVWPGVRSAGRRYGGPALWVGLANFGCWLGVPRLALEAWAIASLT